MSCFPLIDGVEDKPAPTNESIRNAMKQAEGPPKAFALSKDGFQKGSFTLEGKADYLAWISLRVTLNL